MQSLRNPRDTNLEEVKKYILKSCLKKSVKTNCLKFAAKKDK